MSLGAAGEVVRRSTGQSGQGQGGSIFMSEANIRRLVDKLSKMRGAALKLGQFMSIQGRLFPLVHYYHARLQCVHCLVGRRYECFAGTVGEGFTTSSSECGLHA